LKFLTFLILVYPRIEVFPRIFEAGKVFEGDLIVPQFKIKNKGNEILEIIDVKTCCGIKAFLEKLKIPPKDSSFLKFEIIMENAGEYENEFLLITNDPYEPKIRLKVKANCLKIPKPDIETEEIIFLKDLFLFEKKDTFINVYNKGDADLILLDAFSSKNSFINSKFPIKIPPHKKEIVDISFIPEKEIFEDTIRLATNIKGKLYHLIRIKGNAKGNRINLFSPLYLKNDTIIILNSGKEDLFIKSLSLKNKKILKNKILKGGEKIKVVLPFKVKKSEIEIDFKIPLISE
jgi:hypothetical protein